MAGLLSKLFGLEDKVDFQNLLENGAIILDVRTKGEYKQGHISNSINIPLDSLSSNLSQLKKEQTIIAVCASGMRSRGAVSYLRSKGFSKVYNGGSWSNFR